MELILTPVFIAWLIWSFWGEDKINIFDKNGNSVKVDRSALSWSDRRALRRLNT